VSWIRFSGLSAAPSRCGQGLWFLSACWMVIREGRGLLGKANRSVGSKAIFWTWASSESSENSSLRVNLSDGDCDADGNLGCNIKVLNLHGWFSSPSPDEKLRTVVLCYCLLKEVKCLRICKWTTERYWLPDSESSQRFVGYTLASFNTMWYKGRNSASG
jgi:hypothetical protein